MKFTLVIWLGVASCSVLLAQAQSNPAPAFRMPSKPINCESDIALLDLASRQAGENGLIIAIARLGDGERGRDLNHRRLHNVRIYLTEWDGRRDRKTVITAEGEHVGGYGRIELYVGGQLSSVILIRRNGDLIVGSCTYEINSPTEQRRENNLYPWLDRFQRKRPRKLAH